MKALKLALIVVISFLSACDKKGPEVTTPQLKEVPVITGILQRDINAQPIGVIGIPNTNTGQSTDNNRITAYPNACTSELRVVINTVDTATAHIWLLKGEYQEGNTNAEEYIWAEENFIPIDIWQPLSIGGNSIDLDVSTVPNGYYRLYVEYNTIKLWDNIRVNRP